MLSFFKECWILAFPLKAWVSRVCRNVSTLAELEFCCLPAVCSFCYLFSSQACSSDSSRLHGISPWLMCGLVLSAKSTRGTPIQISGATPSALLPAHQYPVLWSLATLLAWNSHFSIHETIMLGSLWCSWGSVPGRKLEQMWYTDTASCFTPENSRVIYFV